MVNARLIQYGNPVFYTGSNFGGEWRVTRSENASSAKLFKFQKRVYFSIVPSAGTKPR